MGGDDRVHDDGADFAIGAHARSLALQHHLRACPLRLAVGRASALLQRRSEQRQPGRSCAHPARGLGGLLSDLGPAGLDGAAGDDFTGDVRPARHAGDVAGRNADTGPRPDDPADPGTRRTLDSDWDRRIRLGSALRKADRPPEAEWMKRMDEKSLALAWREQYS